MSRHRSTLEEAFQEDHRVMTQGFSRLLKALEEDDLPQAIEIADDLDRHVGPHIEFEERVLYPQVSKDRGAAYVDQLYDEHQTALQAVNFLRGCRGKKKLTSEDRHRLIEQVKTALDHAISCGTLLSHLTVLDANRQQVLVEELNAFRRKQHRWTEL